MTTRIHAARAGLVVGALFGGFHFAWALIVALGFAQPLIDFVFWMHFIKPVYVVEPFDTETAVVLVGLTGLVGFCIGWVFAALWNSLHREGGRKNHRSF